MDDLSPANPLARARDLGSAIADAADVIEPGRHRDRAAADEHDHGWAARGRDRLDQRLLRSRQGEVRAVTEFAFLQTRDDDRHLARLGQRDRRGRRRGKDSQIRSLFC